MSAFLHARPVATPEYLLALTCIKYHAFKNTQLDVSSRVRVTVPLLVLRSGRMVSWKKHAGLRPLGWFLVESEPIKSTIKLATKMAGTKFILVVCPCKEGMFNKEEIHRGHVIRRGRESLSEGMFL